jgi:glyoxylase-like metal-dependent hydrolase (beta-lactamase superfamily II)
MRAARDGPLSTSRERAARRALLTCPFSQGDWAMRGIVFAGLVAILSAMPAMAEPTGDDIGYFQEVHRIDKGVWLLTEPKFQVQPIGNVTVIEQSDGLVLVDAGSAVGAGRRIVALVRGLSRKPVKAVIISQWHGDKAQGLSEILEAWPGARTISTAATQAHLGDPATMNTPASPDAVANAKYQALVESYRASVQTAAANAKTQDMRDHYVGLGRMLLQWKHDMDGTLTTATKESFTDRLTIDDARAPVEVLFLGRANTDGDAVVWLPKQRILVAGETVILPFPYGFGSYPSDWIGVLEKIRAYKFRVLLPGHGMPQTDRVQIDKIIAALKDVRAQVDPLAAQGLTLDQVRAKVDFRAQARNIVGDDPWLNHWFQQFWIDPIVASAYKEAKGQPIVQNLKG